MANNWLVVSMVAAMGCASSPQLDSSEADSTICTQNICPPPQTMTVPGDAPTIQAAIDQIGDGGTIQLRRGVYTGSFAVTGKTVHLIGGDAVVLRSTNPQLPLLGYGPGGGGTLERVSLLPAGDGIVGQGGGQVPPAALTLSQVEVLRGATAIAGTFSELTMTGVHDQLSAGGVRIDAFVQLSASDSDFLGISGAGWLVHNDTPSDWCSVNLSGISVALDDGGGLAVEGSACPVTIDASTFIGNASFNIALVDTGSVTLHDIDALDARPRSDGTFGDGIDIIDSGPVEVDDCVVSNNARAGIATFGCSAVHESDLTLENSKLQCNGFALDVEVLAGAGCAPGYDLHDPGGNDCSCRGDGAICQALSSGLAPPETLP